MLPFKVLSIRVPPRVEPGDLPLRSPGIFLTEIRLDSIGSVRSPTTLLYRPRERLWLRGIER